MDKLAELLAKYGAPILATAIGGPLGGVASAAVGALADALGTKPTPDAVAAAIVNSPDPQAAVRAVETDKGPEMLDAMRLEIEDRANARAMQLAALDSDSWTSNMPAILAIILACMFAATGAFLFVKGVPDSQLALLFVGAIISEFRGSLGFFFGTTAGSKRNGDTLRTLAQQATTPTTGQIVGKAVDAAAAKAASAVVNAATAKR